MTVGARKLVPYCPFTPRIVLALVMLYRSTHPRTRRPPTINDFVKRRSSCVCRFSKSDSGRIMATLTRAFAPADRLRPRLGAISALVAEELAVLAVPGRLWKTHGRDESNGRR